MSNYILAHGFGFTNDYWRNLKPLLNGNVFYYGDSVDPSKEYIGIGHSLGFLKLNNSGLKFSRLIGLQGFLNYCGNDDKISSIMKPQLDEGIQKYKSDYRKTLKEFYTVCGYLGDVPDSVTREDLLADLEAMKDSYKHCGADTIIVGTPDDSVIPSVLIEDNFADIDCVEIKMLDLGIGHTLGFNRSEVVLSIIEGAEPPL
ncbi:MAG: hypothetical protein LBM19_04155 [Holosporales bacterium]|jgi:pimeloyl-[acyl-carrier protein] methyl ester esterase|nr:hypothetical protein [Holosporales bacterium]